MTVREPVDNAPVTHRERRVDHASWRPTVGPGMVLGVLSTIGVVVSMFLAWRSGGVKPGNISVGFLFDSTTTSTSPSLLVVLIPLAVVLAVGAVMPRAAGARVLGGLGVIAVVVLFAVQVHYITDRFPGSSMWDVLDTGWYVAGIAGLIGFVSGFMPSGWTRRRWTENEVADGQAAATNTVPTTGSRTL